MKYTKEKNFSVYILTNKITNKKYIGITSQKPEKRWNNGNGYKESTYIGKSIKKYGWENFEHEIIYTDLSCEDAQKYEIQLIEKYNTLNPNYGYNIQPGGNLSNYGVKLSEETRKKMSDRNKGENNYFYGKTPPPPSKEHIEKLREIGKNRSGKNHPFYGKHHSDESKLKKF